MESNVKSESNSLSCCVVCLRDDIKVFKENDVSENFINIYQNLVQNEIHQLGSTVLEFCEICIKTLENIVDFRKQCLSSIGYLCGKMQFNVVFIDGDGKNESEIKLEENSNDVDEQLPLKVEIEEAKHSSLGLKRERKSKKRLPSPDLVMKKPKKRKYTPKKDPKREAAYCSICGEFFQRNLSKHIIKIHTMEIENNQFKCNICDEIFKNDSTLLEHFNKHRDYEQPKTCKMCDASFINRLEYKMHVKDHRERTSKDPKKRIYSCDCCDASYYGNTALKYHVMAKHQGAYPCKYCHKAFFDKGEYEEHIRMEEIKINDRKFYCDHCGYHCKWKPALWIHIKKFHTPDEPLIICNECGKTYKTKTQFKNHQVCTHLEKTHQCYDCGKKFAFATTLNKHIRMNHTLEGAFSDCEVCGKRMRTSSMRTHMQAVHQQIRKWKCDLCPMAFKTIGTLTKHKFTHTKTRPYNCNLCSTGYYQNEYLRKHFERVHGIVYTGSDIRKICGKKSLDCYDERERAQQQSQT